MSRPTFVARTDATVSGPVLRALPCGCRQDSDGAIWHPCPAIRGTHAAARYLASTGTNSAMLASCLARVEAHVAEVTAAAYVAAQQGFLL